MKILRKLQHQRHQQQQSMNQRSENGKQLPLTHPHPHSQRCLTKSNVALIFIVLFFIAATTILQLPTLNYIKYLTSNSNESQIVNVKQYIPSFKTSTIPPKNPARTKDNENIDDDNDEDEDDDTKKKESVSSNSDGNEAGNEDANDKKVDHHDVEIVEEPDDGGDDDHGTNVVKSENEPKNTSRVDPEEGNEDHDDDDDDDDDEHEDEKDDSTTATKDKSGNIVLPQDESSNDDQVVDGKEQEDEEIDDDNEPHWEKNLSPKIVWLASYPNSGTSYTMTLVERASNLSTATNYGNEVTHPKFDSIPIYPNHEEGPFWEGTSEHAIQLNRVIRNLPTTYVLTKTHCGGRCIKCPASEYIVNSTRQFVYGCQKTSYRKNSHMITTEHGAPMSAIKKILHLIRNPYHNVVARFHLERKNMIAKDSSYEESFTYDATGFQNYCEFLDTTFNFDDKSFLPSYLYKKYFHPQSNDFIPCAAEFYKWAQWHNYVVQSSVLLGLKSDRTEQVEIDTDNDDTTPKQQSRSIPVHVIWYENYELDFNTTFFSIMDFLQLPIATEQIRTFRALPTYDDHFTAKQRKNVQALIHKVAIPTTWKLIQHYFE